MERFVALVEWISDRVIWGPPMILAILSVGIYLTVRTGFFQVRKAGLITRKTALALFRNKDTVKSRDDKAISQLQAVSTALAATIGTGNIAGVAAAVTVGGPGAVFWMWISAFFGMMTAFAEHVLGIYYRKRSQTGEWSGGAMYYLEYGLGQKKSLKRLARPLALLFALCCVLASFGMGNMTQINTVAGVLEHALQPVLGIRIPPLVTGMAAALLIGTVILGGAKRIGSVSERVVPVMAVAYLVGTTLIFLLNFTSAPAVFGAIFKGAFGLHAAAGGAAGVMVKRAVSFGFRRGIFSNEAGLGSSVIAGSAADIKEPVEQGMWGIFTVFFDTIVGCTLTAFALLSSGVIDLNTGAALNGLEGAELVSAAFSGTLHAYAGLFVAISVLFFAFSTVIGWSFYGSKAMEYLFGTKGVTVYQYLFVAVTVIGAVGELELVWKISDIFNGLMAVPNLIGIWMLMDQVMAITKNYTDRKLLGKQHLPPLYSFHTDIQREQEEC